jgi:hypothetical protein
VVTAAGRLGADLTLLTLGIGGVSGADPQVVYPAAIVGRYLFAPLSAVGWMVGVVTGALTP